MSLALLPGECLSGTCLGGRAGASFTHPPHPDPIQLLCRFVAGGGGLVVGAQPWPWVEYRSGDANRVGTDFLANVLLAGTGIFVTVGRVFGYNSFAMAIGVAPELNAQVAVEALRPGNGGMSPTAIVAAKAALGAAIDFLPRAREPEFWRALDALALQLSGSIIEGISATSRLDSGVLLNFLAAKLATYAALRLPPRDVVLSPAAASFPGAVPAEAAAAGAVTVTVNTKSVGGLPYGSDLWVSTGVYARPGGLITVTVPAGATTLGLKVSIGCHTDLLWELPSWGRMPEVVRVVPLTSAMVEAASGFGGLVYIRVPGEGAGVAWDQDWTLTVGGATVRAPHYVAGETSLEAWRSAIRSYPAPWAELQSGAITLTVPSSVVRSLEDPGLLLAWWGRVVAAEDTLVAILTPRTWAERIAIDADTVVGVCHNGYPIYCVTYFAAELVDLATLQAKGSHVAFHELGGCTRPRGRYSFGLGRIASPEAWACVAVCLMLPPRIVPRRSQPPTHGKCHSRCS